MLKCHRKTLFRKEGTYIRGTQYFRRKIVSDEIYKTADVGISTGDNC